MEKNLLIDRTKMFGVRIVNLSGYLSENNVSTSVFTQILRSGTSVGANYRVACRTKNRRDFIGKIKTAAEGIDETLYWLELLGECKLIRSEKIESLKQEANELLAIFMASLKTARGNQKADSEK